MSPVGFIIKETVQCIASWLILTVVAVPLLPVLVVFAIYKLCINLIVRVLHPQWVGLDGLDIGCAISINMYKDKVLPNIGFGLICRGDVNVDELRNEFRKQFLDSRDLKEEDETGHSHPVKYDRLQKTLVRFCGYFYWSEPLTTLNLEEIIYEIQLDNPSETVTNFVSNWIHEPYKSKAGPLWEVCLCKNMPEYPGKTLMLFKILHCVGDGYTGARILGKLGRFVVPSLPEARRKHMCASIMDKIILLAIGPRLILHYLTTMTYGSDPLSRKEKVCDVFAARLDYSLDSVKTIRLQLDCRFNDVFLGLLGASCRKFLLSSNEKLPDYIPIVTPVALPRTFSDPMRNRMSTSIFKVPIRNPNTSELIKDLSKESKSFYLRVALPTVLSYFTGIPALLPACFLRPPSGNPRVCCAMTSVIPLPTCFSITDCEVERVFPVAGLELRQSGLLCAVQVYMDKVSVSLMGNKGIFPTQSSFDEFTSYFVEEFQKLESIDVKLSSA